MVTVGIFVAQARVTALIISPKILDPNFCKNKSQGFGFLIY